jgi:hypothetical protein
MAISVFEAKFILTRVRFADRDMLMRYHWGLGIGHVYSHGHDLYLHDNYRAPDLGAPDNTNEGESHLQPPPVLDLCDDAIEWDSQLNSGVGSPMDVEDPELGLEERDKEPDIEWDDSGSNSEPSDMSDISDEEVELHSMYELDY